MDWIYIGDWIVDIVTGAGVLCLLAFELYRIKKNNKKRP